MSNKSRGNPSGHETVLYARDAREGGILLDTEPQLPEDRKARAEPQLSEDRKALYYIGAVVMGAGFLLFISNFFLVARGPSMPFDDNPGPGMAFRGLGGMTLLAFGAFLRNVGARGAAGSGLILDPQQARED